MSLVLRLPRKLHLCRSSSNVPRLASFLDMLQTLTFCLITFEKVHNPLRLPRETTSERQKVVRECGVFNMFTSKCASRHNGLHFFDISNFQKCSETCHFFTLLTSKCASRHSGMHFFDSATSTSAPKLSCFVHFDFDMCFAPQRRALFR